MSRRKHLRLSFMCAGKQYFGMTDELGPAGFSAATSIMPERGARITGHFTLADGSILDFRGIVSNTVARHGAFEGQVPAQISVDLDEPISGIYRRLVEEHS